MCRDAWNKLLSAGLCLAAAGVLGCIAAAFDIEVPKGSLRAFLAAMLPLGAATLGVLIGFVWACDKTTD